MAYINLYNDAGTLYDLHDKRIEEITSEKVGMIPIATDNGDFELLTYTPAKASGNLSLEKTIHYLKTAVKGSGNYQYYLPWYDIISWKNISFATTNYSTYGGILSSSNGFDYSYESLNDGTGTINNEKMRTLCGGDNTIIAATYDTTPKIYYRNSQKVWMPATNGSFSLGSNNYLDLSYSPSAHRFIAKPHGHSSVYKYSNDGITWIDKTLPSNISAWTPILYGLSGFTFYTVISNLLVSYYSKDGIDWQVGFNVNLLLGTINELNAIYKNEYYYIVAKCNNGIHLLTGTNALGVSDKGTITSLLSTDTIQYMNMINNYFFIWTGDNSIHRSDFSNINTTWTKLNIVIDSTSYTPAGFIIYDDKIYISQLKQYVTPPSGQPETANVYTSTSYGEEWILGIYEYTLHQITESNDDKDTTTIIMNLLRRSDGTYELSGGANNESRSYRQTFDINSWTAAESPDTYYYITIPQSTHNCGIATHNYMDLIIDVYTAQSQSDVITKYSKYYGFPSTGWQIDVNTSGDITLSVPNSNARFIGAIIVK